MVTKQIPFLWGFFNCCLLFARLFSTWQMQAPSGTECCTTGNRHGSDSRPKQCKVVHVHWYTKSEMTIMSSCTVLCFKGALQGSTCTLIYWEWDDKTTIIMISHAVSCLRGAHSALRSMYTCVCLCICIHTCVQTHTCIHLQLHTYIPKCRRIYTYSCTYTTLHTQCPHACTHTHTHTHIIAVGWFCRSCLGQQSQSFTLLFSTWSGCLVKFCWWHRNCSQGRRKRVYITCMISVRPALKTETHTPGLPPPPILVYYFCCRFQTKN